MKKVITYGTYDMLHQGHINLLKRAKELGDYLIVGVTTDTFDYERGKLNVHDNVMERIKAVERTGLADQIIIEEYVGQKIDDIQKYNVDIFTVGSDWEGKFDYLNEYCKVVYLPRTEGISSTRLRSENMQTIRLGIIGCGSIAGRMAKESEFVHAVTLSGVMDTDLAVARKFAEDYNIPYYTDSIDELISHIDAAYIASPHLSHYPYAKLFLQNGKHVLNELPFALEESKAAELFNIAAAKGLVLTHAVKTAYCPAFRHLLTLTKSGLIGQIKDIEAAQSTLDPTPRKLDRNQAGGAMTEDGDFSLLPIFMLLGCNYTDIRFISKIENGVDIYTKCLMLYPNATASFKIGLGMKTEGDLVISGTKGYIYVPAPWWKPSYFEARFEDTSKNRKYFYSYSEDGLRYELNEFAGCILYKRQQNRYLPHNITINMSKVQEAYRKRVNCIEID